MTPRQSAQFSITAQQFTEGATRIGQCAAAGTKAARTTPRHSARQGARKGAEHCFFIRTMKRAR
jgi:hypothetical protein